ncbi:MAG: aminotransferase class I/II-fold pyridoxal phosphate-dependent enzyme [Oscillospiraceae bacterium]|nr:aminotransferase class I/II-fold pyridoxal phosphate-dependent enzyme [Oscillospiraceae bacterium]
MKYSEMSKSAREAELSKVKTEYGRYKDMGLKLDMSRGKPGEDQLELANGMLTILGEKDYISAGGIDCRNYGGLEGIPEMKKIFADMLGIEPDEVIVGGNSSLATMFDNVSVNMSHGVRDGEPWMRQGKVKFLCPSPGYDRHFTICEYFHIEMITVPMTKDGPDMDIVEKLAASDPMIKGMWCVPVFSNPDGIVYSDETVRRIAALKTAADDFRLYWDNAYCIHQIKGKPPVIPNILRECEAAGNPNMPLVFASFSKISMAGAGVACMASSVSNCEYIRKRFFTQTIGPDKLSQLRHVRFFKDYKGVLAHMEKMAVLLKPKFDTVLGALKSELGALGVGEWNEPEGGYFVSFNALEGCAKRVVELCKEAGVVMTGAGATFPYGKDPHDRNIRIAPTYPKIGELQKAMEIFCAAVKLASLEKLEKI